MKKHLLLLVSVLVIRAGHGQQQQTNSQQQAGNAQPKLDKDTPYSNKVVTFDFANPVYPSPKKIKPRQSIALVLQNLNPYLYDVTINDSLIIYASQQPPLFGQLFKLPELHAIPSTPPTTNLNGNGNTPIPRSRAATAKKEETSLEEELKDFISDYSMKEKEVRDILSNAAVADNLQKLLVNCYSTIVELKEQADAYITGKLEALPAASLPSGIQGEIEKLSADARLDILAYMETGESLKKQLITILDRPGKLDLNEYKSIQKDINEKVVPVDKILENCKKLLSKLDEFDQAKVGTVIEENYKKLMTSRIQKTIIKATMYNTDEVLMNVKVKKKNEGACKNEIGDFPVIGIVTGGVKIDFSTGLVVNIGNRKFFDQKYHYDSVFRNTNTFADSVSITRNRNNNVVSPSIGVFFHVYTRILKHINGGGMFGASLASDERLYYHLGGCVMIGKSDRVIIGFGASIAKAEVLNGQYVEGQQIKRSLAPTAISTETSTRIGMYTSVTWNLNLIK
ncbi:MAG: hypothetical protein JWN76_419 [Chitinophagaceae bacterium]|nr:hypothetical protein [Chitinophagaceae bacterium]